MSALESLKKHSTVVVDTGDFKLLEAYRPEDATMNPSLLLSAAQQPQYEHLLFDAIEYGKKQQLKNEELTLNTIMDRLAVNFGKEILQLIPGVVSTEINPKYSFDVQGSVEQAERLIAMYEEVGVPKNRILIKLATTWEGCQAVRILESKNIRCNMTLIFSLCQALAAADAKATLISPFVGRILDWHKSNNPNADFNGERDPGVISVQEIFTHYKSLGSETIVMAASFRNVSEILNLAGCDKLTISPKLLEELNCMKGHDVTCKLRKDLAKEQKLTKYNMTESTFRWMLNEDRMATEKLSEGIRNFYSDSLKLKNYIKKVMCSKTN